MASNEIIEEMKKKVFFSRFSNAEVVFVDSIKNLTDKQLSDKTKAYFDGMFLLDNIADVQDDISSVVSVTKGGRNVNLQDYYERHGAFDENGNRFLKAIKNLRNKEISDYASNVFENLEDIKDDALLQLLNKPIEELDLSVRASNCLKNANVRTVFELTKKTEDELSKTRNFGKVSLSEIKKKLLEFGLTLGMKNYRNVHLKKTVQKEKSDKS